MQEFGNIRPKSLFQRIVSLLSYTSTVVPNCQPPSRPPLHPSNLPIPFYKIYCPPLNWYFVVLNLNPIDLEQEKVR